MEFMQPFFFKTARLAFLNRWSVKLAFFYIPLLALLRRKDFDVIFSWPMQMGLWFGILNRFCPQPGQARHLMRDFHINLTRHDPAYRLRLLLVRKAIKGIDFFLCTSRAEETIYAGMFKLKPAQLRFLHEAPPNHFLEQPRAAVKDYILAYGNSDRDFDTLIQASREVKRPVVILSQNYAAPQPLPPHVILIRERIGAQALIRLIAAARMVVLPMEDYRIAAGQLGMMETMALGRPLLVTANMATEEFAAHGETAFFYEAKNVDQLKQQLCYLWDNPEKAEAMGRRARESCRDFAQKEMSTFFEVLSLLQGSN